MWKDSILENQQKIANLVVFPRETVFPEEVLSLHKIFSVIGPRRAGKTYYLVQTLQKLIQKKTITKEQIVWIDFTEFSGQPVDFVSIKHEFKKIYPTLEPFFVFDELQEVPDFTQSLMKLYNQQHQIFVTGSNAKLLSQELATQLRGRNFEQRILPLSFREYLTFVNQEFSEPLTENRKAELSAHLHDFLTYGGYPEVALVKNKQLKKSLLQNYHKTLIFQDLIERYRIKNEPALRYLMKRLILNVGKETNVHKIFNELKSQNIQISKNTLYQYLEYLENIFWVFPVSNYASPRGRKKYYLYDTGYMDILHADVQKGPVLENAVLLEHRRQSEQAHFLSLGSWEIDLYDPSSETATQVCYKVTLQNVERETRFLAKGGFKQKSLLFTDLETTLDAIRDDIKAISSIDYFLRSP